MKINNAAAAAAAAPAFVAAMNAAASKADNANLAAACAVLVIIRDAGGTNKKSASSLWALLPEDVVSTFAQVKRVNGAINAPAEKATDGANTVRPLWLAARTAKALTDSLISIGIKSPRALLDLVAPRADKKESAPKKAVEIFLAAARSDGFKESVLPLLVWVAERHGKEMARLLAEAEAFQAGVSKDAEEKNAAIEAKQAKAEKAKAAKAVKATERARLNAEALAEAEKLESDEKSAKAKQVHAEKIKHERATHPKVRAIIEA